MVARGPSPSPRHADLGTCRSAGCACSIASSAHPKRPGPPRVSCSAVPAGCSCMRRVQRAMRRGCKRARLAAEAAGARATLRRRHRPWRTCSSARSPSRLARAHPLRSEEGCSQTLIALQRRSPLDCRNKVAIRWLRPASAATRPAVRSTRWVEHYALDQRSWSSTTVAS